MERKLFLSEDLGEDIVMDDGKVVADEDQILTNLLTATIKGEWDAVELYNSILGSIDDEEAIKVLNEIVSEEYVHIGQLEKLLQDRNNASLAIEDGKEHDEHDLEDVKVPEEDVEVETEGLKESFGGLLDDGTPVEITYSHNNNPQANKMKNIIVGLYIRPDNPPDRYHYEIDPWFRVYTKVKPDRILSTFRYDSVPLDWMSDVDAYAKDVLSQYDDYKEIDNKEFEKLARDKWKRSAILPDEPGGELKWKH